MRKNNPLVHFVIIIVFILLQSTVLGTLLAKIKFPVFPDFAFVVLIFSAISLGSGKAQTIGFVSGLVLDLLSYSSNNAFGFFALIYTVTGFILGKMKGKFFIDPVLVPMLITFVCCLFRALFASILGSIFLEGTSFFTNNFLIESGLNIVIAPVIIALMKLFKVLSFLEQDYAL